MAKKSEKFESGLEEIEYISPNLTRVAPDTGFVIDHKTGRCLYIFRKIKRNEMINRLVNKGINIKSIKNNKYGDLLIM